MIVRISDRILYFLFHSELDLSLHSTMHFLIFYKCAVFDLKILHFQAQT